MYISKQEIDGYKLHTIVNVAGCRIHVFGSYVKDKKPRVFVEGEEYVDFSDLYAIQGWPTDKSLTPEFNRRNRKVIANKRKLMNDHADTLAKLGLTVQNASFSRKGGCPCGCSPSFIADHMEINVLGKTYNITEIHITAT